MTLEIALSSDDIIRKLRNHGIHSKFIIYDNIHLITSIEELLPYSIIFYKIQDIGHFVCMFRDGDGHLNYFDPIGGPPDNPLEYYRREDRISEHHDFTYLLRLLFQTGEPIIYNEHKYQTMSSIVCGYWVFVRLVLHHIDNDDFFSMFRDIALKDSKIIKLYNIL